MTKTSNKAGAFSIQWMKEIFKLDMFHTQELLPDFVFDKHLIRQS